MSEPRRMWSVTTLISAGTPKEALIGWAARVTAERAFDKHRTLATFVEDKERDQAVKWLTDARWEKSGSAAARGIEVHKMIEAYALGQTPDVPDELAPWDEQVKRFLDDHQPVFHASESPVYNVDLDYAGTMDLILEVGGRVCLTDAKSTDKAPDARSRPPYGELALQCVGYSRCTQVGVSPAVMRKINNRRYYEYDPALHYEPMPNLDGALGLIVSPYDYQLVPVRIDDEVWRAFLAVREVARWNLDISKRVFGPHIAAPAKEVAA